GARVFGPALVAASAQGERGPRQGRGEDGPAVDGVTHVSRICATGRAISSNLKWNLKSFSPSEIGADGLSSRRDPNENCGRRIRFGGPSDRGASVYVARRILARLLRVQPQKADPGDRREHERRLHQRARPGDELLPGVSRGSRRARRDGQVRQQVHELAKA